MVSTFELQEAKVSSVVRCRFKLLHSDGSYFNILTRQHAVIIDIRGILT